MKQINVKIPDDYLRRLNAEADRRNTTRSNILRERLGPHGYAVPPEIWERAEKLAAMKYAGRDTPEDIIYWALAEVLSPLKRNPIGGK